MSSLAIFPFWRKLSYSQVVADVNEHLHGANVNDFLACQGNQFSSWKFCHYISIVYTEKLRILGLTAAEWTARDDAMSCHRLSNWFVGNHFVVSPSHLAIRLCWLRLYTLRIKTPRSRPPTRPLYHHKLLDGFETELTSLKYYTIKTRKMCNNS